MEFFQHLIKKYQNTLKITKQQRIQITGKKLKQNNRNLHKSKTLILCLVQYAQLVFVPVEAPVHT